MAVRRSLAALGVLTALAAFGTAAAGGDKPKRALANPFFVFENGVKDATYDTPQKQVALLKRLGYDGMEKNGLDDFAEVQRDLLARARPHLFAVSINGATNVADKSDRGTIWKSLIQPLGQGTFDTYARH